MLVKFAFLIQKFKKNIIKSFGHDQERWGGGGRGDFILFWILWGDTTIMRGT